MLIFFIIIAVYGFEHPNCTNLTPRNDLLLCFSQLIDINQDQVLNRTEIDNFNNACCSDWPSHVMSPSDYYEMKCDINHDGILDMSDWNHRHACCKESWCVRQVCAFCYLNGWTGPN